MLLTLLFYKLFFFTKITAAASATSRNILRSTAWSRTYVHACALLLSEYMALYTCLITFCRENNFLPSNKQVVNCQGRGSYIAAADHQQTADSSPFLVTFHANRTLRVSALPPPPPLSNTHIENNSSIITIFYHKWPDKIILYTHLSPGHSGANN